MSETTGRLLRLLSLLQARRAWSGDELARRLEVTDRTLRRDIARLRDLGYPVEATPGRYGGYRLVAGGAIPPLLLDEDEAVAVAWGLRAAAAWALPGFEDPAVMALAKIEQVLPSRVRDRIHALADATVRIGSALPSGSRLDVGTLVTVARAHQTPERLRFVYRDASGRESERHVEPYRLVHAGRRWYLFAWDRDREDWRSFRIDRMSHVHPTGMRFQRRDDAPDAAAFVAEGLAVGVYSQQARVVLHCPIDEARRLVSPTAAVLEEEGEKTLMRLGADDMEWIARYLAGMPVRFTILEPPELVDAVTELARQLDTDATSSPAASASSS
ncbi:MAG TPA: YafY family protein [Acidimicrobiia bacterium]|jgi:predicted DNA-binding transcriptional regulator YafY